MPGQLSRCGGPLETAETRRTLPRTGGAWERSEPIMRWTVEGKSWRLTVDVCQKTRVAAVEHR